MKNGNVTKKMGKKDSGQAYGKGYVADSEILSGDLMIAIQSFRMTTS